MTNEKVRMISNNKGAIVCYVRIVQSFDGELFRISNYSETRVWELEEKDGRWVHVHFHRSEMK